MSTIWKFPLRLESEFEIELPEDHELIRADRQCGVVMLWAIVDPKSPPMRRKFFTIATGEPFSTEGKLYLNSIQFGDLVWHIFAETGHAFVTTERIARRLSKVSRQLGVN